mgnify:CR=1 FL=1
MATGQLNFKLSWWKAIRYIIQSLPCILNMCNQMHNDAWILTQSCFILNIILLIQNYWLIVTLPTCIHQLEVKMKHPWLFQTLCEMLPGLMFDTSGSAVFYAIAVFNDICKKLICRRIWNMQYCTITIVLKIRLNKNFIWLKNRKFWQ